MNKVIDLSKEEHPHWHSPNAVAMGRYGTCKENVFNMLVKDVRENKGITVEGVSGIMEHLTEAIAIEDHVFNAEQPEAF